ncbi:MAG: hypothetical protein WC552_08455 [Candidatus Omnitrophota bacterium]
MIRLRSEKAQALIGEYALALFIVVAAITAMSLFFQRALQGRIHDARSAMQAPIKNYLTYTILNGEYKGETIYQREYEPYYSNSVAEVERRSMDRSHLLPGGSSGIFRKTLNETTGMKSKSTQLPPKDAY